MGNEVLSKEAKQRVRTYAQAMFDTAVDNVRIKWKINPKDWNPRLEVKWSGDSSYAWVDRVLIVFCPHAVISGDRFVNAEYPHIAKDHEIGSFYSVSWRPIILALIAHELAHSLNMYVDPGSVGMPPTAKNADGNHGKKWQDMYRWIIKFGFNPGKRTKAPKVTI